VSSESSSVDREDAFYGHDLAQIHAESFASIWDDAVPWLAEIARAVAPNFAFDIGCGDGRLLAGLGALGVPGAGVDISPALSTLAQRRGLDVTCANAMTCAIPSASLILALGEVLAYVGQNGDWPLVPVIERAARALVPGGALVFDITGPDTPESSSWRQGRDWFVASRTTKSGSTLTRDIVTFRWDGQAWHRRLEQHHQRLIPDAVVHTLFRQHGLIGERLPTIGPAPLLPGRLAFIARKPA
jgi:SAM-dependent methyltransferase